MKSRFVPLCSKTHRIGNRLIQAGNAELARTSAVGFVRKRHRIANVQPFSSRKLPGDEDCGHFLGLRRGVRGGPPGDRRERCEGENENQEPEAGHSRIMDRSRQSRLSSPCALALTAPASRERVAPIVFRPPAGATRVDVTGAFGAEDGRKRIGDRTRRAASTQASIAFTLRVRSF